MGGWVRQGKQGLNKLQWEHQMSVSSSDPIGYQHPHPLSTAENEGPEQLLKINQGRLAGRILTWPKPLLLSPRHLVAENTLPQLPETFGH
jgi:hypothetical protein